MDFKEKDGYKPDVKLEYIDDSGRLLSQKEAFRYLSHRFHGKGSGKKKTEKRGKKIEEENVSCIEFLGFDSEGMFHGLNQFMLNSRGLTSVQSNQFIYSIRV